MRPKPSKVIAAVFLLAVCILIIEIAPQVFLGTIPQPIYVQRFDQYWATQTLYCGSKWIWANGTAEMKYPHTMTSYGCPPLCGSQYEQILGQSIPSTIFKFTYTFKFKIQPDTRLQESQHDTVFLWWGHGYEHIMYDGDTYAPLFVVYLSPADNNVYILFDHNAQVGSTMQNVWPFTSWKVNLGSVADFSGWTQFTVWINNTSSAFVRINVGGTDVPFPPGYTILSPNIMKGELTWGASTGEFSGSMMTNAVVLFDDVEVYAEFFMPSPSPTPTPPNGDIVDLIMRYWWLILILIVVAAVVCLMTKKKTNKARN